MLHEILLALSGYSSPLFKTNTKDEIDVDPEFPFLQPAEKTLLRSIGKLSHLHRNLKNHLRRITTTHNSAICRAVAASIQDVHLQRFQKRILDVESRILQNDASLVGAYKIVPLASIVGEFDGWPRVMEWYWQMTSFMLPIESKSSACSAAELIDRLRKEALTGYPDIENAATSLGIVAEKAWLQQTATWILYGDLPVFSANDFFIQKNEESQENALDRSLCPNFVSDDTRASILFIGRSLKMIESRGTVDSPAKSQQEISIQSLALLHSRLLSNLQYPLSTSALARAISDIRLSLSRNALAYLLPPSTVIQTLDVLRDFFLLGRGEFAMALIAEADVKVEAKSRANASSLSTKLSDVLKIMAIKDAELRTILSNTWATLARHELDNDEGDDLDETLDVARDLIQLVPCSFKPSKRSQADQVPEHISFNDLLLPMPTKLSLQMISPMDLFLSSADLDLYSSLNAYLISIRRAHTHLSSLWRETSLRRENLRSVRLQTPSARSRVSERANQRHVQMRKFWATGGAAIFFLSELGEYLEGQVLNEAWHTFRNWIEKPVKLQEDENPMLGNQATDSDKYPNLNSPATGGSGSPAEPANVQRDPEVLAAAHRRFLASLDTSLLHTNISFTKALRSLLANIDLLVAHITRLKTVQQNLDLESSSGDPEGSDGLVNYQREEVEVHRDLDRSRKRVDADLKAVVRCLRDIDTGRDDIAVFDDGDLEDDSVFRPNIQPRIERLLMKLDFASGLREEEEGLDDERFHDLL